jgi:phosphopantothenoylcysteine decarboxylase/phosphopantothenate--cysteine ligase
MLEAVEAALPADIFIAAAAVADWRAGDSAPQKIKKKPDHEPAVLTLVENPDILSAVAQRRIERPELVAGFAAETENLIDNAKAKLARKGCDMIIANSVRPGAGIFGGERNRVTVITAAGVDPWPDLTKEEVGERLIAMLSARLRGAVS